MLTDKIFRKIYCLRQHFQFCFIKRNRRSSYVAKSVSLACNLCNKCSKAELKLKLTVPYRMFIVPNLDTQSTDVYSSATIWLTEFQT